MEDHIIKIKLNDFNYNIIKAALIYNPDLTFSDIINKIVYNYFMKN